MAHELSDWWASLTHVHPDTLRVTGIGSFGVDGVRIVLPEGVSALETRAVLPNEPMLPAGAYLEISSRARGSAPDESLGFTRITRLSTPGQYAVTGAIAGAAEKVVALYKDGAEVYRDRRPASPTSTIATLPACLACKLAANDDLGTTPLSPLLLRWDWTDNAAITISNRPNGAPDTTVTGDELRILEPDVSAGNYRELSEFLIRGKDLGEIRILSEETRTVGVDPEHLSTRALWFAPPSPNPSRNGFGSFAFSLGKTDLVSIEISDVAGRRVAQRPAETFSAGSHVVRWPSPRHHPDHFGGRLPVRWEAAGPEVGRAFDDRFGSQPSGSARAKERDKGQISSRTLSVGIREDSRSRARCSSDALPNARQGRSPVGVVSGTRT